MHQEIECAACHKVGYTSFIGYTEDHEMLWFCSPECRTRKLTLRLVKE